MGQVAFFVAGVSSVVGTAKATRSRTPSIPLESFAPAPPLLLQRQPRQRRQAGGRRRDGRVLRRLGVAERGIAYVRDVPAGHAMIAPSAAHRCDATASPYVNRCDVDGVPYDQAKAVLTQIYGPLSPPRADAGEPVAFDQRPFADATAAMADTGYVYVPSSCAVAGAHCRVHVALHGCLQAAESVHDALRRRRLQPLGRVESADRALSPGEQVGGQRIRLLGLVGLHGQRMPRKRRRR